MRPPVGLKYADTADDGFRREMSLLFLSARSVLFEEAVSVAAVRSTSSPREIRGTPGALRCRRKFLRFFPQGFRDETYLDWERGYKVAAHRRFEEALGAGAFRSLLEQGREVEAAERAIRVESRTHLLFSFEKMALRDAVREPRAASRFAHGLYDYLHGGGPLETRFERWRDVVANLPRRQTRVLTWPAVTVFGFLARPKEHFFFKPNVTRRAARAYGVELSYRSRPDWEIYRGVLDFARSVRRDLRDLSPRDMIDIQSFLWVQGSEEYD
jgi:hypothetical protein